MISFCSFQLRELKKTDRQGKKLFGLEACPELESKTTSLQGVSDWSGNARSGFLFDLHLYYNIVVQQVSLSHSSLSIACFLSVVKVSL